jgi:Fe-S-cluster containining protein
MEKDSLCRSCSAACCRYGVVMELTRNEVDFMMSSGVSTERFDTEPKKGSKKQLASKIFSADTKESYILTKDCSFLELDNDIGVMVCSIYFDESRPEICSKFKAGEYGCMSIRNMSSVDSQEVFVKWKENTQS